MAAREELRRQLAESNASFSDLRRKLTDLETRLQGQQRMLEQANATLADANRRLVAALEIAIILLTGAMLFQRVERTAVDTV